MPTLGKDEDEDPLRLHVTRRRLLKAAQSHHPMVHVLNLIELRHMLHCKPCLDTYSDLHYRFTPADIQKRKRNTMSGSKA